jgi:hypothetical protein
MGELVDAFGGKVSGELIRAADWNGMLTKVEAMFEALAGTLGTRIDALETRADGLETRMSAVEERLDAAEPTLDAVRNRFRRLDLSAATTTFAIGQRGEIIARVSALDGGALDLSNAATRPWVDFVTVWGTLKPASGFTSRGGAGDQTLSVQVNAAGEARVLIRAAHAEAFAEEEELEIEGFLSTRPQAGSSSTIADMVLGANTPRDATLNFAYQAISQEYDRTGGDQLVLQRYVDTYYLTQPSRAAGNFTSVFTQRWRDYRATVMAFLKPDSDPTSADGALASASIQVTFRDWIAPWIIVDYLPGGAGLQIDYGNRFRNRIGPDLGLAMNGIVEEVNDIIAGKGIIAKQRDLLAVESAIGGLTFDGNPPAYMPELVQAVQFGTQMQHAMFYGQAITPGGGAAAKGFEAMTGSAVKASAEAGRVQQQLTEQVDTKLAEAADSLRNEVKVAQLAFEEDLLREDGPILSVQRDVQAFSGTIQGMQTALNNKANVDLISNIIGALPR